MVNYEPFLGPIALALQSKDKNAKSLTDAEIKAGVAIAYKEAVHEVAQRSDGYRMDIPLHIYEGVKDYPIEVPTGFRFNRLHHIHENSASLPPSTYIEDEVLRLPCCATKTYNNAVTLKVSVLPSPTSSVCEYHQEFVDKYYTPILAYIRYTLAMQGPVQKWGSLGAADRLLIEYKRSIKRFRNESVQGRINIRSEKLSDVSQRSHITSTQASNYPNPCNTCG